MITRPLKNIFKKSVLKKDHQVKLRKLLVKAAFLLGAPGHSFGELLRNSHSRPDFAKILCHLINPTLSRYVWETSPEALWENCVQNGVEDWVEVVEDPRDHEEHVLDLKWRWKIVMRKLALQDLFKAKLFFGSVKYRTVWDSDSVRYGKGNNEEDFSSKEKILSLLVLSWGTSSSFSPAWGPLSSCRKGWQPQTGGAGWKNRCFYFSKM